MPDPNATLIYRMLTALVDASPIIASDPIELQDNNQQQTRGSGSSSVAIASPSESGETVSQQAPERREIPPASSPRSERLTYGLPVKVVELNNSGTIMQCTGQHNDVSEWFAVYLCRYAPAGYGTKLTSDRTVDGVRTIKTDRARSCD